MYRFIVLLIFVFFMVGCGVPKAEVPHERFIPTPHYIEAAANEELPSPKDFNEAVSLAEQHNRPLLVVYHASWCPPCQRMKHNVWPNEEVQTVLRKYFVAYYLDVDEEYKLSRDHNIRSLPTYIVYKVDSRSLSKVKSAVGYKNANSVVSWLESALREW